MSLPSPGRSSVATVVMAAAIVGELACAGGLLGSAPVRSRPVSYAVVVSRAGPAGHLSDRGRRQSDPTVHAAGPALASPASIAPGAMSSSQTDDGPAPGRATPAGGPSTPAAGPTTPASGTATGADTTPPTTPTPAPVTCRTDLALSRSPATPYAFLCEQGATPVTWAKSRLVIYDRGLTTVQSAALTAALVQWQAVARFQVALTTNRSAADVVISSVPLTAGQAGYTEDGYTTVAYRCAPVCAYYHSDMELSSTASLAQTDWVSTVLHELGHVAGLNHVSETGEVMYPYLTLTSPVLYSAGDRAGLALLAAERGS